MSIDGYPWADFAVSDAFNAACRVDQQSNYNRNLCSKIFMEPHSGYCTYYVHNDRVLVADKTRSEDCKTDWGVNPVLRWTRGTSYNEKYVAAFGEGSNCRLFYNKTVDSDCLGAILA